MSCPSAQKRTNRVLRLAQNRNTRTAKQVEDEIVCATSLARGDVRNALTSLAEIVNSHLEQGALVDLSNLGTLKVVVNPKMMDTPEQVTAEEALKTPFVSFYPKDTMLTMQPNR